MAARSGVVLGASGRAGGTEGSLAVLLGRGGGGCSIREGLEGSEFDNPTPKPSHH